MNGNETEWRMMLVDQEGLKTALAEVAWASETKNKDTEDLYDTYIGPDGEHQKIIADHWASKFFLLREYYGVLLESYIKNE